MNRPSFGRRVAPQAAGTQACGVSQPVHTKAHAIPAAESTRGVLPEIPLDPDLMPADAGPSLDEELRAWKQQRSFIIPWKQVCLMATICFGVASFALPATVNRSLDWVLYGLTAMSFYAWFTARRSRPK